jgi:hypothetical protein
MNPVFAKGNYRTVTRLKRLYRDARSEKAYRVAERIRAVSLSIRNHTAPEIAELLGMSRGTVPLWIAQWNTGGIESLLEGFRSGRPRELSEEQLTALHDIIESGPVAYGFDWGSGLRLLSHELLRTNFPSCITPDM